MIDFATLTGAMVIALGKKVAGFFASSPELAEQVQPRHPTPASGSGRCPCSRTCASRSTATSQT